MGLTRKMGRMDSKKTRYRAEQPKQTVKTMKLKGTGTISRKRKRVVLSSALAVFLTFTLAFSSFAWGAVNDVSSTVFANDAISDIPAENAQDSVLPGGENKANKTAETDAASQESPVEGLDESAGNADDEAFTEESNNTGADGGISAAAENEDIEPLAAMVEAEDTFTCMTVQNIPYIDANGVQQTCPEATVVAADKNEWTSGWYIAENTVDATERFVVKGDVHLILAAGCTLNATKGITVSEGNSLTIYAQSTVKDEMGTLNASGSWSAGIGGYAIDRDGPERNCGSVTINGGIVSARGSSACAGIGGAGWGNAYFTSYGNCGTVTINGGWVTAYGAGKMLKASAAAAIGNSGGGSGGTIRITGGTVTVEPSGVLAAGIGGGADNFVGTIVVSGGHIIANVNTSGSSSNHNPCIGNTMSLSTGSDGTAFIETNDPDFTGNNWGFTSGIVLNDGNYYIRGNQTLSGNPTVERDKMLQLYSSATLTIPAGVTLTNNNIIKSNANTTLVVDGHLVNNGAIENNGGLIKGTGTLEGDKPVASKPPAPTAEAISSTSVTLKAMPDIGYGPVEYVRTAGDGTSVWWQSSPTFDSLQPDTEYTFYARYCGNNFYDESSSPGTVIRTPTPRPGVVSNVTVVADNYLGADFVMPGDYVADAILPAYARKQLSLGKDVDIWMESNRITDGSVSSAVESELGDFLPAAYFGLTSYWQVEGETPVQAAAETRDDAMVMVRLKLPDSAINTDPSITREYKVVRVYNGVATTLITRYDPDNQTVEFRTNKFASFCLACKDTRDGKTVYPVMVRDGYAQDSGQGQYAAGDTVVVNAGVRDGYMVEFWNGTPSDKIDFTIIDSSHASFVMPEGAVMVSPQWIRIGDISDVTDVEANAFQARLVNSGVDLAERVLPADALAQLPALKDVDIWLRSVEGISDADAALVTENLGDWVLTSEVDLTLFYKMDGTETQIHETNKPVTVQLTLPDSAINTDASKTRTYEVLRVHEGAVSVIPVTFDADAKTLTFETDRFSAYAIAYKDTAATTPDGEDPGDNGSNSTTPGNDGSVNGSSNEGNNAQGNSAAGALSATGDSVGALVVLILCMVGAAGILDARHRRASSAQRGKHASR